MKAFLMIIGLVVLIIISGLSIGMSVILGPGLAARFLGDSRMNASSDASTMSSESDSNEPLCVRCFSFTFDPHWSRWYRCLLVFLSLISSCICKASTRISCR
jgi:hypothetical protein